MRDWSHAKDVVRMQWLMLQQNEPSDFVISSDRKHSVREFVEIASKFLGFNIKWVGKGLLEKGIDVNSGKCIIRVNKKYFRPNDVDYLRGDSSKARRLLGWKPKISFKQLVKEMVESDLKSLK